MAPSAPAAAGGSSAAGGAAGRGAGRRASRPWGAAGRGPRKRWQVVETAKVKPTKKRQRKTQKHNQLFNYYRTKGRRRRRRRRRSQLGWPTGLSECPTGAPGPMPIPDIPGCMPSGLKSSKIFNPFDEKMITCNVSMGTSMFVDPWSNLSFSPYQSISAISFTYIIYLTLFPTPFRVSKPPDSNRSSRSRPRMLRRSLTPGATSCAIPNVRTDALRIIKGWFILQ